MRLLVRIAVTLVGFMIGLAGTSAAFALNARQDGKITQFGDIYATEVAITGDTFNPRASQCVVYSNLMYDITSNVMNQAGLLICRNTTIDGTCNTHYGFAERYNGSTYYCVQGNYFTQGTAYPVHAERGNGSAFTTVTSFAAGASAAQVNFLTNDDVYAYAWAEATSSTSTNCPLTPHHAEFRRWKKTTASGTSFVSGALYGNTYGTMTGAPCWTISSGPATGDFNVD